MKASGIITLCCLVLIVFSCKKQEFYREVTYTIGGDPAQGYAVVYYSSGNKPVVDTFSAGWSHTFAAQKSDTLLLTAAFSSDDTISINATIWVNEKMISDTVRGLNPTVSIIDIVGD